MATKVVDLSELLANAPRNCWLALNDDETRIVGHGATLNEALAEARKAGFADPVVLWAPEEWVPTVFWRGRERRPPSMMFFQKGTGVVRLT